MTRPLRAAHGGLVFHVLNRANARTTLFHPRRLRHLFETVAEAQIVQPMTVLCYCIMPNHWHFILAPGRWRPVAGHRWLTQTHTQRCHASQRTIGCGHVYQGRFKSFAVSGRTLSDRLPLRGAKRRACRAGGTGRTGGVFGSGATRRWKAGRRFLCHWPREVEPFSQGQ